jgi:hypothetical protein
MCIKSAADTLYIYASPLAPYSMPKWPRGKIVTANESAHSRRSRKKRSDHRRSEIESQRTMVVDIA